MNLAKISTNGQITVPIDIRRILGLKDGDKILFMQKPNGEIVVENSSLLAIREAQTALKNNKISEDDILNDVMNIRYGENQ
jgi:antitoxin PrlF